MAITIVKQIITFVQKPDRPSLNFGSVASISPEHIPQAFRIAQVLQDAINPQNLSFDLNKAISIVHNDLSLGYAGHIDQLLMQESSNADMIIDKITKALKDSLSVVLHSDQVIQYRDIIVQSFNDLTFEQGSAWIFWSHEEAHKTTYQYNILFALNDHTTGNMMYALALGSTITVNIETEKVLCAQVKNKHEYSVLLQGIKVYEALGFSDNKFVKALNFGEEIATKVIGEVVINLPEPEFLV